MSGDGEYDPTEEDAEHEKWEKQRKADQEELTRLRAEVEEYNKTFLRHMGSLARLARERCELRTEVARKDAALRSIKWRSVDKDNMEFSAVITYSQMDAISAALTALGEDR